MADVAKFTIKDLLALFAMIINELNNRGVVRTQNNPVADFSEWLVANTFDLTLQENSKNGFDAIDSNGMKYQIKGRRLHQTNSSRQLSVIRNLKDKKFDFLIGVLFNEDFSILEAYKIPHEIIPKYARYNSHQNGHILMLKGDILGQVERIDVKIREFLENV